MIAAVATLPLFEGHEVHTIADEKLGVLYNAPDVCEILGYANAARTIADHCRSEGVLKRYTLTSGGKQQVTYITEANLIRLIAKSKKPNAEAFEAWIFDTLVPTVLKTAVGRPVACAARPRLRGVDHGRTGPHQGGAEGAVMTRRRDSVLRAAALREGLPEKYAFAGGFEVVCGLLPEGDGVSFVHACLAYCDKDVAVLPRLFVPDAARAKDPVCWVIPVEAEKVLGKSAVAERFKAICEAAPNGDSEGDGVVDGVESFVGEVVMLGHSQRDIVVVTCAKLGKEARS